MTAITGVSMQQVILEALGEYLAYLNAGGTRVELPTTPRAEDTMNFVWASKVGWCPLQSALSRAKAEPFVEQDPEQFRQQQFKMAAGTRVGELLQEAMFWKFADNAVPEVRIINYEWMVKGKMDISYWPDGSEQVVLEIKTSASTQPRWGQVIQTLIYLETAQAQRAYIVLCNPFAVNSQASLTLWRIEEFQNGYVVYNEQTGDLWDSKRNGPEFLNHKAIGEAIHRHRSYMEVVASLPQQTITQADVVREITPPFSWSDEEGWQCLKVVEHPHRYQRKTTLKNGTEYQAGDIRQGQAEIRCPYFCHGRCAGEIPVDLQKDDQGIDREVFLIDQEE